MQLKHVISMVLKLLDFNHFTPGKRSPLLDHAGEGETYRVLVWSIMHEIGVKYANI